MLVLGLREAKVHSKAPSPSEFFSHKYPGSSRSIAEITKNSFVKFKFPLPWMDFKSDIIWFLHASLFTVIFRLQAWAVFMIALVSACSPSKILIPSPNYGLPIASPSPIDASLVTGRGSGSC